MGVWVWLGALGDRDSKRGVTETPSAADMLDCGTCAASDADGAFEAP